VIVLDFDLLAPPSPYRLGEVVEYSTTDHGPCGYCDEPVIGSVATTRGRPGEEGHFGPKVAVGPCVVWRQERVFAGESSEGLVWVDNLVPWHEDCLRWVIDWTVNPNAHLRSCRYASPDGQQVNGTRGEVRVAYDADFCRACAPIDDWLDAA
jgi:hypothetical protein